MFDSDELSPFRISWLVAWFGIQRGYGFLVGSWFAHVRVVGVVEARLIELGRPSCLSRSPEYRRGWFMFVDQLCWLVGMLGTIIRIFVGCLGPCVGFRRWVIIPPLLDINGHGGLISTSLLGLGCVGWIESVISNSRYGSIALFDVSQFGFVFDDFVFELGERAIFRVGIGLDFIFFSAFSVVGRSFYTVFGDFKGNRLPTIFL